MVPSLGALPWCGDEPRANDDAPAVTFRPASSPVRRPQARVFRPATPRWRFACPSPRRGGACRDRRHLTPRPAPLVDWAVLHGPALRRGTRRRRPTTTCRRARGVRDGRSCPLADQSSSSRPTTCCAGQGRPTRQRRDRPPRATPGPGARHDRLRSSTSRQGSASPFPVLARLHHRKDSRCAVSRTAHAACRAACRSSERRSTEDLVDRAAHREHHGRPRARSPRRSGRGPDRAVVASLQGPKTALRVGPCSKRSGLREALRAGESRTETAAPWAGSPRRTPSASVPRCRGAPTGSPPHGEEQRRDRSARVATDVLDVGDLRVEQTCSRSSGMPHRLVVARPRPAPARGSRRRSRIRPRPWAERHEAGSREPTP